MWDDIQRKLFGWMGKPYPRKVTQQMVGPTQVEMTEAPTGGMMVDPESIRPPEEDEEEKLNQMMQIAQLSQMAQSAMQPSQPPPQLARGGLSFEPFGNTRVLTPRRRGIGALA